MGYKEEQQLRSSLKEMLDAFWGEGDGNPPPDFIVRAQKLAEEPPEEEPHAYGVGPYPSRRPEHQRKP